MNDGRRPTEKIIQKEQRKIKQAFHVPLDWGNRKERRKLKSKMRKLKK